MTEIQVFSHDRFGQLRMVEDGQGDPWFVATDVAKALGYRDAHNMARRLDNDEKGTHSTSTRGGEQEVSIISEAGLYTAILGSKLETAKQFKRWVTHDILPAIRKHGGYLTPAKTEELINNPDLVIQLAQTLKAEREKRARLETDLQHETLEHYQTKQQLAEAKPKASYYDVVLQSNQLISVTQLAKDFGLTAQKLNRLLSEAGVQFKQGKQWFLYKKYAEQGYTQSKTQVLDAGRTAMHTYWTQKGRLFVHDLLKTEYQIYPVIELDHAA